MSLGDFFGEGRDYYKTFFWKNKILIANQKNTISGKKTVGITLLLVLLAFLFIKATFDEVVSDKNRQIDIYQKEIEENHKSINSYASGQENLNVGIDTMENRLKAINDFLKDYQDKNFLSPQEIAVETNMVMFLEDDVERIQQSFRNKIINLYKHGKNYELELLLSSKTPNEFLRRNEYLQRFALSRKKELKDLKTKKLILEEKKNLLTLSVSSQRYYVELKRNEKKVIDDQLKQLKIRKSQLDNSRDVNDAAIARKEEQINRIKDFISVFSENKQNFRSSKTNRLNYAADSFDKIKGGLNLPVDFALIENEFGDYMSNATDTKWFNNGIDFSIAKGSKVYAVAGGTVSLTGEVPFYGKVVIINHDGGYRTVYASLNDVNVNAGDKVKPSQIIGKTGETPDGQALHFELWLNGTPLNPKEWLRF